MLSRLASLTLLVLVAATVAPAPSAQTVEASAAVVMDSIAVGGSGMGGRGGGPFTLVSLRNLQVVSNADSASTAWDLGLRGTTVLVNGGTSGPGTGAAVLAEAAFPDVADADGLAFVADGDGDCPRGEPLAICTGSGNGWYLYAGNGVEPLPERTLVVRLADGSGLAKVRFVRYLLSEPLADGSRPRYYTLEVEPLSARAR